LKAGKAFVIERLEEKEAALEDPDEGLFVALDEAGKALRSDALAKLVKRPKTEVDEALARLSLSKRVIDVSMGKGGPAFVSSQRFEAGRAKVQQVLREKHQKRPHKLLVPRADLRA